MAERIGALMVFAPGSAAVQFYKCVLVAPVGAVMANQSTECQHGSSGPLPPTPSRKGRGENGWRMLLIDDGCGEFGEHGHLDFVGEVADVVPQEELVDAVGF